MGELRPSAAFGTKENDQAPFGERFEDGSQGIQVVDRFHAAGAEASQFAFGLRRPPWGNYRVTTANSTLLTFQTS